MVGEGDPTRVAAQVVTGIGFLGAGIILREGINVHGLNTAATLWCSAETCYSVTLTCKSAEEAHLRSLLLHALSQGGCGLRRIDSSDIPDTSNVIVTALVVAARRNDAALEQIVGRLSLEPHVSAVAWQVDRTIPEA